MFKLSDLTTKNKIIIIAASGCVLIIIGVLIFLLNTFANNSSSNENEENTTVITTITEPAIETSAEITTAVITTAIETATISENSTVEEITTIAETTTEPVTEAPIVTTPAATPAPIVTTVSTTKPVVTTSYITTSEKSAEEEEQERLKKLIDKYYNNGHEYNTDWGMRPLEFDDISRNCQINYNGQNMYMHYDRYGNTWIDDKSGKTSAEGKYIYSRGASYNSVAYFQLGGYCYKGGSFEAWTKNGESVYSYLEDNFNDKYSYWDFMTIMWLPDGTRTTVKPEWIRLPNDMPVLNCDITFNDGYYTVDFSRITSLPESPYIGKKALPIREEYSEFE